MKLVLSRYRFVTVLVATLLVIMFLQQQYTSAATITEVKPGVPVSLKIPDTDLRISGCVAPSSLVTIIDDNTVVGTVTSGSNGQYTRLLSSQTPTIHSINVFFDDPDNIRSNTSSELVALPPKTLTKRTINPAPTVIHTPDNVQLGQIVNFKGYGCPNKTITVLIDNNLSINTQTDSEGYWDLNVNSINFSQGSHSYSVSGSGDGYLSGTSRKQQFNIIAGNPTQPIVPEEADLSVPVVISSPEDGYRTDIRNVLVSGTGPANAQIEVFVDGVLAGSVFSNSFGEWSLSIAVLGAQQTLSARACNSQGCGDISNQVRVLYGDEASQAVCSVKLSLDEYRFNNLSISKGIDLNINILGGNQERYEIISDWGDITIDHQTTESLSLKQHHTYKNAGHYNGTVSIQDESGCKDTVYFSVRVIDQQSNSGWSWHITPLATLLFILYYLYFSKNRAVGN